MAMKLPPRIVDRKPIYRGWNKIDLVTVEATGPDGKATRHEREVVDHGDAAVVLVFDPERQVALLVRQWRAPLMALGEEPHLLEVCAGIMDEGESAERCAIREAEEELGVRLKAVRAVGTVAPSAGTLTERMHLFIAEAGAADFVGKGGGVDAEGEDIEVVELALAEALAKIDSGEITDGKTIMLLQFLALHP